MVNLSVDGPYDIQFDVNSRGTKSIEGAHGRQFFDDNQWLSTRRGCYIFAIRTGRGLRAAYIGKATKTFAQEVFTRDKLHKYNRALFTWVHGSPVFLFILTPTNIRSSPLITDVEEYLIRSAKRVWPDILNKHHTGQDSWDISGVTTPHAGRRSGAELALVQLLKLD